MRCLILLMCISPTFLSAQEKTVLDRTKSEWIKILQSDDKVRMRRGAVIALGIFGPGERDTVPVLSKALLTDKEEVVRLKVIEVWGNLSDKELQLTLEALAEALKSDKVPAVRAGAAKLLGNMGELAKPALGPLQTALTDADPSVRSAAIHSIGRIGAGARGSLPSLQKLLQDADANVRFGAVFALGRFGVEGLPALPDLLTVLEKDTSADVRREAARALGMLGGGSPTTVRPGLVQAIKSDKNEEVRQQAALAVGKLGVGLRDFMPAMLEAAHHDSDRTVRLYCVRSMGNALGGNLKPFVRELGMLLEKEPDGEVKLAVIQELGALGADAMPAVPLLQAAESDVQVVVREAAKAAVKRIKMPPPPPAPKDE